LFLSWSAHRQEIVQAVTRSKEEATRLEARLAERLDKARTFRFDGGVLAVHRSHWPRGESISWMLEKHQALWIQPLRSRAGWEYFDVVSLEREALEGLLGRLLKAFPLEIVQRGRVGARELAGSFFVPLNPVLGRLTPKQTEAILGALDRGYYTQPRGTTTRDVAKQLGLSRSAFEERLRNAENVVIEAALAGLAGSSRSSAGRTKTRTRV
jgi:predicted DNA binding protein